MTDAILGFGLAFTLEDRFTQTCKNIRGEFATFAGDAEGFQTKMNASMNGIMQGFGMMGAGVALLAPLGIAVKDAANFEVQLKELSAITGVTGAGLEDIGNRAQNLALKFGGDPLKSVDSFKTILSRLGPDIAKSPIALQNMGDSIETLAKTMGGDTLGSVNALTTGMLQYSIDLSDPIAASQAMAKQMNVMAAAAQVGSAEVPQIAAALKVSGLAAKSAGLSFEEANAAIQIMGKGTVYGAEAGTALRNVLGKLGENRFIPKDTSEELKKAGVNLNVLADTTIPLSSRLKELNKIQNDAALVGKFFGVENKNAAMLLMQNIGDLEQWTKSVTGTNSATDQAAVIMGSFNEAMKRNKASIEVTSIAIGTALLPAASKMLNIVSDLLGAFTEFAQSDIGKEFVKIAGAIGVGLVGMGSLVVGYHSINMAITAAKPAMEWFKASILTTNAALLPYIAVAAGVAVITYGLVKAYNSFSDVIAGGQVAQNGFLRTMQQVGGLMHFVAEAFSTATATSVTFSAETQSGLKNLGLESVAYNLGAWVINIKAFFGGVWDVVSNLKNNFADLFSALGRAGDAIGNVISKVIELFGGKNKPDFNAYEMFGKVITQYVIFPLKIAIGVIEILANTVTFLSDVFTNVFSGMASIVQPIRNEFLLFKNDLVTLPQFVATVASRLWEAMSSIFDNIGAGLKEMVLRNIAAIPGGEFILKQLGATITTDTASLPPAPKQEEQGLNRYVAEQKATQMSAMMATANNTNSLPSIDSKTGANAQNPIIVNNTVQIGNEQITDIITGNQEYQDKRKN
jgi:TP901 family phage tail tape measure protein